MAAITARDVRRVALLARLGLSEQRARELAKDLNAILDHMEVLARVDTAGIAEVWEAGEGVGLHLRGDHGPPIPLGEPPEAFAPELRDGFFLVPRISTHESASGGEESPA